MIKATLPEGGAGRRSGEKIALFSEAGRMYIERSSNQAEAIKGFQRVLDIDRSNHEAITHLKEMYEKRRDWEKLVDVMRAGCELLDPADHALRTARDRADRANEKLRKPNVCIELWRDVSRGRCRQRRGAQRARGPVRARA